MKKRYVLLGAAATFVGAVALLPVVYNVERRYGYVTKFWEEDDDFVYKIPSLETDKKYDLRCMHVCRGEEGFFRYRAPSHGVVYVDVKGCTNSTGAVEDLYDFFYNTVKLRVKAEDMRTVPIHLDDPKMTSISEDCIELYTKKGKNLAVKSKTHAPSLHCTKGGFTLNVEAGRTYIFKVSPTIKSTDDYVDSSVRLSMKYV